MSPLERSQANVINFAHAYREWRLPGLDEKVVVVVDQTSPKGQTLLI